MEIPVHIAEKLWQLAQGESIAASSAKHAIIETLIEENIIERSGRIKKVLRIVNPQALFMYLQNNFGLNSLPDYIQVLQKNELKRTDLVAVASHSKLKKIRTFKGFLLNGFEPISVELNHQKTTLSFTEGTFQFIYDFTAFYPDPNLWIIGIENPENFRYIAQQKYLFENLKAIFVSRYPQNQSKDFIQWLQSIPNPYLHFGDFDLAGINIYLQEYKKHLGKRAQYFIPDNIETLLETFGNKNLYNQQKENFRAEPIEEEKLLNLISLIHKHRKGLEQEVLIKFD